MPLAAGQTISFYEVLGPIGAGGMGEVYLARDTRLDREVAIKVLPEEMADDEERLRRFEREAKTLASLNHPNVAGIHGIDQVQDTCFLAMELVPGADLEERLQRGALPLAEALDVCRQIAEGLEAAHEAGVVHRDLKPANVRITPEGAVKILDFGLAKPLRPKTSSEPGSATAASDSFLMTEEGLVLGTPTYMSPEQARGKPVDRRTDIWAFGCVLFECLTGERAFAGDSMTDILAAIVGSEPDWSRLPPLPRRVEELLRRCLTKDPRHRLRDVGEARITLQAGGSETAAIDRAGVRGSRSSLSLAVAATLVVGTGLGVLLANFLREPATEVGETGSLAADVAGLRFALPAMTDEGGFPVPWRSVALSPDGRQFAAATIDGLVVRRLDSFDPIRIRLDAKGLVDHVAWSPDGASLAVSAGETLYRVSAPGGTPVRLFDDEGFQAHNGSAWLDDGRIVFTHDNEERDALLAISSSGGRPSELVTFEGEEEDRSHLHDVAPLPGGRILAVLHADGETGRDLVAIDDAGMHTLLELPDEQVHGPQYVAPGFVLFSRGDSVSGETWAQPISLDTLEPTGELFLVQSDMRRPSVSGNGTLAYVEQNGDPVSTLVWWARDGGVQPFGREHEAIAFPVDYDSSAGLVLFMTSWGPGAGELWRHEIERGVSTRIRVEGLSPTWGSILSDGRIVVTSKGEDENGDERMVSYLLPESGRGAPERWLDGHVFDVSDDLRYALYSVREEDETHLYVADLESDASPLPFRTGKNFHTASISPDGRWATYDAGEIGNTQVYLTRFPSGEGDWQVSVDDGVFGRFAPDGGHIYFREARGGNLSRVTFQDEPEVRLGAPELVGELQQQVMLLTGLQDADGERFLGTQLSGSLTGELIVVLGWANELAER